MRAIRFILATIILAGFAGSLSGCATEVTPWGFPRFVDVYINDANDCVVMEKTDLGGTVVLYKNDVVIFNNLAEDKVTLVLPEGWFEEKELTIEPGKRKAVQVIINGPKTGGVKSKLRDQEKDGNPNMKVGEEP